MPDYSKLAKGLSSLVRGEGKAARTFKTTDGYTFREMPDGTVTDGDMTWPNVKQFFQDMPHAYQEGDQLGARRAGMESYGSPTGEQFMQDWANFMSKPDPDQLYQQALNKQNAKPKLTVVKRKGGGVHMQVGGLTRMLKGAVKGTQEVLPLAEREANRAKFLAESVDPRTFYHGTKSNVPSFIPGNKGTFVSPDPNFASEFVGTKPWESGQNVMPVRVQVKKPFDYDNPEHIAALTEAAKKKYGHNAFQIKYLMDEIDALNATERMSKSNNNWASIERPEIQSLIKDLGHDSYYTSEFGTKNLSVYDPRKIKSDIGNRGTYDVTKPDINEAKGGAIRMQVGGALNLLKAAAAGEKVVPAVKATRKFGDEILQSTTTKMMEDLLAANPKLTPEEAFKKASTQAEKKLTWEREQKPALVKQYGPLARASYDKSNPQKMQNTRETVQKRIDKANEFLDQPTEPWTPPRPELQAFDRNAIKDALEGFPGIEQTAFPRDVPTRASTSHVEELYTDPVNRELIKKQIKRGLPLGGETFYASLYPIKQAVLEAGMPAEKFDQWIYSLAPASARNSIINETAVGQFLRNMHARGIPINEENVRKGMDEFKAKYGIGLPLFEGHWKGVKNVLENDQNLRELNKANIPTNYKIPTYGTQKAGDFGKSVVLDVHEAAGQTQGSRYHPYFNEQGGFGNTEYNVGEQGMMGIADELGIPGGMAQAGRWFGGGELTGLKSPRGDALDILERQVAYTLKQQGKQPNPANIRAEILNQIKTGEGELLPWYKKENIPDVRETGLQRKDGGTVENSFTQRLSSALQGFAIGGEVSDNTTPDMTDGGQINYGGQYANGGKINMPVRSLRRSQRMAGGGIAGLISAGIEGAAKAAPKVDRLSMSYKDVTKRVPEVAEAIEKLSKGEITKAQYNDIVNMYKPVLPYNFVPKPASTEEAVGALRGDAAKSRYGMQSEYEPGTKVGLRLDIPAYTNKGVWVNSIHDEKAKRVAYGPVSSVKNAELSASQAQSKKIAMGGEKAPYAKIKGEWNPMTEQEAVAKAQEYLNHPEWKQIGFDPERHSYFYDRATMAPITGADEVIQIGPLVLGKNPKYGKIEDFEYDEGGYVDPFGAPSAASADTGALERAKRVISQQLSKEGAALSTPEGRKDVALKIASTLPGLGLGGDLIDLVDLVQSMIPGLNKPASVMDTEGKGDKVAKYPLRGLISPPSSRDFQDKFKEMGILGETEAPVTEFAGMMLAPGAIAKAPRAIEGGLNRATAAARRGSTPAMLTAEAVAPDLGQFRGSDWQNYLTKKLITEEGAPVGMTTMGGQKTQKFPGQGLYVNKAGEFESNPMVGVSIPRAGNLSKNKPLLADIATAGQELGQEAMAAHRFIPMMTNQIKDATSMMITGAGGKPLTAEQVKALAARMPDMIVSHSPQTGGLFLAPYSPTKGIQPEFLEAQKAVQDVLGKGAKIQYGRTDPTKDLLYFGDYAEKGARAPSAASQEMRKRLKSMEVGFPRKPSGSPSTSGGLNQVPASIGG